MSPEFIIAIATISVLVAVIIIGSRSMKSNKVS